MILDQRQYRALINHFVDSGSLQSLGQGVGMRMTIPGALFTITEMAVWDKRSHVIDYIIRGNGWMVNLFDSSNLRGGRYLVEVQVRNRNSATKALQGYVRAQRRTSRRGIC
jgi:hypothetical protein